MKSTLSLFAAALLLASTPAVATIDSIEGGCRPGGSGPVFLFAGHKVELTVKGTGVDFIQRVEDTGLGGVSVRIMNKGGGLGTFVKLEVTVKGGARDGDKGRIRFKYPLGEDSFEVKLVGESGSGPCKPPQRDLERKVFCFGALGNNCGQPQGAIPLSALCANGTCFINGGSWDHDECCFRNKGGHVCDFPNSDDGSGRCRAEFDKALRLSAKGFSWSRSINFQDANTTGRVDHQKYCAPINTLIQAEDRSKCCSGSTRVLSDPERVRATLGLETLVACK